MLLIEERMQARKLQPMNVERLRRLIQIVKQAQSHSGTAMVVFCKGFESMTVYAPIDNIDAVKHKEIALPQFS